MTDSAVAMCGARGGYLARILSGLPTLWIALVLASVMLVLPGCTTRGGTVPYDSPGFRAPDAPSAIVQPPDYRIGPLDTLAIAIFRVPDLSGEVQVNEAGKFNLPLIGEVMAGGKTTDELAAHLRDRLSRRFLQDPQVQVSVKNAMSQRVTIEGSVAQPGIYPISGRTSLIQAVALARGTNQDANPRRVVIFRQIDGKRQAAAFDLQSIRRGAMNDPEVYGNDVIVVDGSKSRSIFRDVISSIPAVALFRPF